MPHLTPAQDRILAALDNGGNAPQSQVELARAIGVSRQAVSVAAVRMIRRNALIRTADNRLARPG